MTIPRIGPAVRPFGLVMVAIRDSKAEAWMTPLFFQSSAQAVRSFGDAVNDAQSDFAKHPEDYALFELGRFDPATGEIVVCEQPVSLAVGVNLLREV